MVEDLKLVVISHRRFLHASAWRRWSELRNLHKTSTTNGGEAKKTDIRMEFNISSAKPLVPFLDPCENIIIGTNLYSIKNLHSSEYQTFDWRFINFSCYLFLYAMSGKLVVLWRWNTWWCNCVDFNPARNISIKFSSSERVERVWNKRFELCSIGNVPSHFAPVNWLELRHKKFSQEVVNFIKDLCFLVGWAVVDARSSSKWFP